MPETYILKIRSGRNKVHKKRLYFWLKDYEHVPRQKNRDFYQKKYLQSIPGVGVTGRSISARIRQGQEGIAAFTAAGNYQKRR